jgi:hypothetical protein
MTGPEHYLPAEELLSGISTTHPDPENITTAQVHATLALAAATALSSDFRSHAETDAWRQHHLTLPWSARAEAAGDDLLLDLGGTAETLQNS